MAPIPNLEDIFVSDIYLAITCEVEVAVHYALEYICKNGGAIWPFSMLAK